MKYQKLVRLAARVVHLGGFGTCVPGAWSEHTHMHALRRVGSANRTARAAHSPTNLLPGTCHCPTQPNRPSRAVPGTKLWDHGLNTPTDNQMEGPCNPHSARHQQPNKPPARNPPLSDETKSLQALRIQFFQSKSRKFQNPALFFRTQQIFETCPKYSRILFTMCRRAREHGCISAAARLQHGPD